MKPSTCHLRLNLILMSIFMISSAIAASREPKKDKSKLYEKFPVLVSEDTDPCIRAANRYVINILDERSEQMKFYSTKKTNEMGLYKGCQGELGDIADFVVMNSNVSHISGFSRMGHCYPKECKQHHFDKLGHKFESLVNLFFSKLPEFGINLDGKIFRSWT